MKVTLYEATGDDQTVTQLTTNKEEEPTIEINYIDGEFYIYYERHCGAMASSDCTLTEAGVCTDKIHHELLISAHTDWA